ncbi:MAG: type II toxin-antitoxin system PemK/MazF family toxin [Chloroflexi bacterium]|nr:type II toxin-antitoxin system PemK/MazF family toxin [Chloroflexota bacterium]MBI3169868.1 type II toxin-antitoxin system PemK/MazF family toxin [Chloroflexota bacterium]
MHRGDIVLVDLPQVAGASGHEQIGMRPALVVHNDTTSSNLSVVMIVPVTSNLTAKNFPHTLLIQPSKQNGLSMPSVLLVFQLRAIDKQRIKKKLGEIEPPILDKVDIELKSLLGI